MDLKKVIIDPEKFFGFQLGSDRKIARWDDIVSYFDHLQECSSRIIVQNIGATAAGNPFFLVIISAPHNLENLETIRKVNLAISDPENLCDEERKRLIIDGKAVICQSMGLHANEIGGSQMAPELAYDLLTRTDEETHRILENVIFLMVPSSTVPSGYFSATTSHGFGEICFMPREMRFLS